MKPGVPIGRVFEGQGEFVAHAHRGHFAHQAVVEQIKQGGTFNKLEDEIRLIAAVPRIVVERLWSR